MDLSKALQKALVQRTVVKVNRCYLPEHNYDRENPCYRDIFEFDGNVLKYYVHRNLIFTYDFADNVISVSHCGYETNLTRDRLNFIFNEFNLPIRAHLRLTTLNRYMLLHVYDLPYEFALMPNAKFKVTNGSVKPIEDHTVRMYRCVPDRLTMKTLIEKGLAKKVTNGVYVMNDVVFVKKPHENIYFEVKYFEDVGLLNYVPKKALTVAKLIA